LIKKIKSADDEQIDLENDLAVKTNTNVESWLNVLIKSMHLALQKQFNQKHQAQSNNSSKRSLDKESMSKQINETLG